MNVDQLVDNAKHYASYAWDTIMNSTSISKQNFQKGLKTLKAAEHLFDVAEVHLKNANSLLHKLELDYHSSLNEAHSTTCKTLKGEGKCQSSSLPKDATLPEIFQLTAGAGVILKGVVSFVAAHPYVSVAAIGAGTVSLAVYGSYDEDQPQELKSTTSTTDGEL